MNKKLTKEEFFGRKNKLKDGIKMIGEYIDTRTPIEFQCSFGHIWCAAPSNVYMHGSGCPYCAGVSILVGFNDLETVRPDIAKMLKNKDDGKKFTYGSNEKVEFICPTCGSIVKARIKNVCRYGLSCHYCADGVSYPNKFGRAFLRQLPLSCYETEYNPDWAKPYFYDNYFEYLGNKYVLEMDGGLGHGRKVYKSNKKDTKGLERDELKDFLAMDHGINVIRIDCLQSDMNYIKNNIINSHLSCIFDLSHIDWIQCDQIAQNSLIKESCKLYMSGIKRTEDIGNILHIHRATVNRYLQKGAELGLCDFAPSNSPVPIAIVDINENIIMTFRSHRECVDKIRELYGVIIDRHKLHDFCESKQPYKGLNFRLINQTIQN